jgi:hypothetical protein
MCHAVLVQIHIFFVVREGLKGFLHNDKLAQAVVQGIIRIENISEQTQARVAIPTDNQCVGC